MVPFCPCLLGSPSYDSRKQGTLIMKGLLRNLGTLNPEYALRIFSGSLVFLQVYKNTENAHPR